jgi:hypothetical protein
VVTNISEEPAASIFMVQAANFSETLVNTETIRCHNPENYNQKKGLKKSIKMSRKMFLSFLQQLPQKALIYVFVVTS